MSRRQLIAAVSGAFFTSKQPANARERPLLRSLARSQRKLTPLKKRAMLDYQQSMAAFGQRLTCSNASLRRHAKNGTRFDVILIGSGYGGAITAARLAQHARPGVNIALLERGREWLPGTYPDTLRSAMNELRNGFVQNRVRRQLGLFDFVSNKDINVFAGNALGGSSIINANVAAMPDYDVFAQCPWPQALQNRDDLQPYYDIVAAELNLQQIHVNTCKTRALAEIARASPDRPWFHSANLAVTHHHGLDASGRNRQGVMQRPCILCGDCNTGCNVGAKNTLQYNYLPLARQHGTHLFTQTEVDFVQPLNDESYRVWFNNYQDCGSEDHKFCGSLDAKIVVIAAGCLGSNGILLRSRNRGLCVSSRLGCGFSGNGDTLGFVVKAKQQTNSAGFGAYETDQAPVGAAQMRNLDLRNKPNLHERLLIQEGTVTRAYANAIGPLIHDPNIDDSLLLLATGHDGACGKVVLRNDRPIVVWPGQDRFREYAIGKLRELAASVGGRIRQLRGVSGNRPTTVHPLGGCGMADTSAEGVTNHLGQVFASRGGATADVHQGLYVNDGSIIPTSLGANPFFTISAIAERIAQHIVIAPENQSLFLT